jgi:hypothetical protein
MPIGVEYMKEDSDIIIIVPSHDLLFEQNLTFNATGLL